MIHLGGLGDTCLSESTFFSLSEHFTEGIVALGYTRFLKLFQGYFKAIERIESARWLPLFSQNQQTHTWERIIFIGKDREGTLRKKWGQISVKPIIFIEMYPEGAFVGEKIGTAGIRCDTKYHVERFQLMQLKQYGIAARKKEITPNVSGRVILYPEEGVKKEKWHHENFIELYYSLKEKGVDVCMLNSLGLEIEVENAIFFEKPEDIKGFFKNGGIFVSNDSGMAHLAGVCGLYTITIFNDFDPDIWHPLGYGITLKKGKDIVDVNSVEIRIMEALDLKRGFLLQ